MKTDSANVHCRKSRVALLSVASNFMLVVLKLSAGIVMGSVSVISEAIHSAIDLLAAVIAFLSVRKSAQPADKDHPFGHGKYENLSGAIEALLIAVAAVWIIYEALHKMMKPAPVESIGVGVAIMFVSCAVNLYVSRKLFKIGRETDSVALKADGWHLMTDVYTSLGVMLALAVIMIGHKVAPSLNLQWLDPVAALLVAMLIIKAAWDLTHEAVRDLLDTSLSEEEEGWIIQKIRAMVPSAKGHHELRTRKAGATRFIEFHLMVDAVMTVGTAHDLADRIEEVLKDHFAGAEVNIHIEPCDMNCHKHCREGCFMQPV